MDLVGVDPKLSGMENISGVDSKICEKMDQEENDLEESQSKQKWVDFKEVFEMGLCIY